MYFVHRDELGKDLELGALESGLGVEGEELGNAIGSSVLDENGSLDAGSPYISTCTTAEQDRH